MNWRSLLVSPPPTTGWSLDGTVVAACRRDPKGQLHWASESVPGEGCEVGPVGLHSIDPGLVVPLLRSVQGRVEGAGRAALVVPTGWVRIYLLEFDELPRRQAELDQVVQWRLKKLLPVPPTELRVSSLPLRTAEGKRPLLCMVGLERAMADLESVFLEAGVELGLITPRLFALARHGLQGARLLVQQESGFLSLLMAVDDVPRLLRTKPLAAGETFGESVQRELRLAQLYIRDKLGVEDEIGVTVSAEGQALDEKLRRWWSDQEGIRLVAAASMQSTTLTGVADQLGGARVAPVCEVITEAAR